MKLEERSTANTTAAATRAGPAAALLPSLPHFALRAMANNIWE